MPRGLHYDCEQKWILWDRLIRRHFWSLSLTLDCSWWSNVCICTRIFFSTPGTRCTQFLSSFRSYFLLFSYVYKIILWICPSPPPVCSSVIMKLCFPWWQFLNLTYILVQISVFQEPIPIPKYRHSCKYFIVLISQTQLFRRMSLLHRVSDLTEWITRVKNGAYDTLQWLTYTKKLASLKYYHMFH